MDGSRGNTHIARGLAAWLFLSLNFLFLLTSSGRVRTIDEVSADFEVESIATRGTTAVPQAVESNLFFGKYDRAGKPQPPYGFGQAILTIPWYAAARFLSSELPGIPAGEKNIFLDAVLTASSATFSALAAVFLFLIFSRIGISTSKALLATLLFALGTLNFAYSAYFFSEPQVAASLLAATLVLFASETASPISLGRGALAGLAIGFALWVRPTHIVVVPIFLLAIFAQDRKESFSGLLSFATVVGIFGAAYLLRNFVLFGNVLDFGYPNIAEGGKKILGFDTPLLSGLYGFLLSPAKSVFLFAPPLLLAIPGLRPLWNRRRGLAVLATIGPLAYLLFFSRYTQWEGGYCVGPRYMLPAMVLLCLGLGPMLEEGSQWIKRAAIILLIAGIFVQLTSMATSFLEDEAGGSYYDHFWNLKTNYAPLISQTKLWIHYAFSPAPAAIGRGFDRWFVFLAKAGISHTMIALGLSLEIAGLLFCLWKFRSAWQRRLTQESAAPSSF
jgi:hypothetical protein